MSPAGRARRGGFALLPVVLALSLVGATAYLMTRAGASGVALVASAQQTDRARYVAEAALRHALWQVQASNCSGFSDVATKSFGADHYSATVTPTSGSPVTLSATGTLADGTTHTLTRAGERAYETPTNVVLQLGTDPGKDTLLDSFYDVRNFGAASYLQVNSASGWIQRPLIRFDLSSLPAGVEVISARLELKQWNVVAPGVVSVHRVARDWVEGTKSGGGTADGATWPTFDGTQAWAVSGGDFDPAPASEARVTSATNDQWMGWEVAEIVEGWLTDPASNHGMLLGGEDVLREAKFASREASNPADAPRLTVIYACECGQVCGSGGAGPYSVLLVVGNATALASKDVGYKALIESPGHTVILIDDGDTQTNFDSAMAAADVIYVSGSSSGPNLLDKLTNTTKGMVNEVNGKIDNFGFSSSTSSTVTTATFSATNATHYITEPFGGNPVTVFNTSLTNPVPGGTLAPDLKNVGEVTGTLALGTLDAGATRYDGNPSQGRRAHLPFASAETTDMTANGATILLRALEWAADTGCGSLKPLLLVVSDAINPTVQETARQTLMESWCYTVTRIDDDATTFDLAAGMASSDVIYISQEITTLTNVAKLRDATIGVVSEHGDLIDDFGMASGTPTAVTLTNASIIDNVHYITDSFPLGDLTLASPWQPFTYVNAGVAAGVQVLADVFNKPSLLVADTGAELLGSAPAPGRRVQLPWGSDGFDFNALNIDGLKLMQRALEWAAGLAGPLAHWKLDETTGITAVDSAGGHDGTLTNNDPTWGAGQLDGALSFDGSNDYIDVPHDDSLSLSTFSITGWVQATALSGWQIVVSKGNSGGWNYYLGTDGSEISIGFHDGGTWAEFPTSGAGLTTGQWYHLTGTFDDATGGAKIYLNGAPIHSGTTALHPTATSDAVMIGNSPAGEYWPGLLDDVRIYDRVLDDAEIAELATGGCGSPRPALLVVGDATLPLSSMDAGRAELIEGVCFAVSVIDDGDSQTNFDTAVEAADVVFVSGTSSGPALLDKLTGITKGVVNEVNGKLDNFGFSSSTGSTLTADTFSETHAAHYVSSPFGGDAISVFSASLSMPVPSGTLAPGLQIAAGVTASDPALVTLDVGAERWDGGSAPARRVHLPFASADTTQMTAEGQTLLQRAVEWAAGAGGGGEPEPPTCASTFRDEFNAQVWSGSDGTLAWASDWIELGEGGTPTGGDIMVIDDMGPFSAHVRDNGTASNGAGIRREADLSAYATATLSFDFRRDGPDNADDYVTADVSDDGGATWTELDRFAGEGQGTEDPTYQSRSYPISDYRAPNTRIRFLSSPGFGNQDIVYFDNVEICVDN